MHQRPHDPRWHAFPDQERKHGAQDRPSGRRHKREAWIGGEAPDREWLETLMTTVALGDRRTHRPSEMSGGQQQRVAVARALISRPAVVFADEPTGNLDSASGREVLDLLRRAVDEFGQAIVMVTHDAGAAAVADRVLYLADGLIVGTQERPSADDILDQLKALR